MTAFAQLAQAQSLNIGANPDPIVPSGESLEFTLKLDPSASRPGSYFITTAPTDWVITSATFSGVGTTGSVSIAPGGASVRIDFTAISNNTDISIFMRPGCSIVYDSKVLFEYYSSANVPLAQGTSAGIANIKYPVLEFTVPADTTMRPTTEGYRTWKVEQTEQQSYFMGGDLTVNVVTQPNSSGGNLRILSVELFTTSGWQPLAVTIAPNQLSYTYTFTTTDFLKIVSSGKITSTDEIRVRERIRYDYCSNSTPATQAKLVYTFTHVCGDKVKQNAGRETVVSFANPYPSGTGVTYIRDTRQSSPGTPGQFIISLHNQNDLYLSNIYFRYYKAMNPAWGFNVISCYFSDNVGNQDMTAPPITVTHEPSGSLDYIWFRFLSTQPYKSLVAMDADGICNDLVKSTTPIYITINWEMAFENDPLCTIGACGSNGNVYLFNQRLDRGFHYYMPKCTSLMPTQWNDIQAMALGFQNGIGSVANPVLVLPDATNPGTTTTMTITDYPPAEGNFATLANVAGQVHRIELTLPVVMVYTGGLKINGVTVPSGDINWDPATRTLSFQNTVVNMTSAMTYSFDIEVVDPAPGVVGAPPNRVYIKHTFDWDGKRYTYGCQTVPVSYRLYINAPCRTYAGGAYRVERASFGYTDKTMTTRYTSIQDARNAGADLKVIGPFDDVEFEFTGYVVEGHTPMTKDTMTIDDGLPLYMDVGYRHHAAAPSSPYFLKRPGETRGALFQYQRPDEAWSSVIEIPYGNVLEIADGTGGYTLRVNIEPYLRDAGGNIIVPRLAGTAFKVLFLTRATGDLPNTLTNIPFLEANIHGIGIYGDDNLNDGCNMPISNLKIFNYQVTFAPTSTSEVPTDMIYWQNGASTLTSTSPFSFNTTVALKLCLNNNVWPLNANEIFPNEFRPNAIINGFTFNFQAYGYYNTFLVDKAWDSEGKEFFPPTYDVNHISSGYNVSRVVFSGMNAATGEYFKSKDEFTGTNANPIGAQSYYVFLKTRSICNMMYNYQYAGAFSCIDFPTSAAPAARNITSGTATQVPSNYSIAGWSISTSTTSASVATGSKQFAWPLRLTNNSTWTNTSQGLNTNYFMPNIYLFIEIQEGTLDDLELFLVKGGSETKILAPWESYSGRPGFQSYWIKIGTLEGEYLNSSSCKLDFMLKGKHPDCNNAGRVRIFAKFAVNTVTYPTNPYAGFTLYNQGQDCRLDVPTLELKGEFLNMDFSGTVVSHPTGVIDAGKFALCKPATFDISFVNNLSAPVTLLEFKVYRTSSTALTLFNLYGMYYRRSGGTPVYYDPVDWVVDDTNEGYILVKLPLSLQLSPRTTFGDVVTVTMQLEPTCDFFFGTPIYIDVYGTSMCNITEYKSIATSNIRLDGYDEAGGPNPQLPLFFINGTNVIVSYTAPYKKATDGKLKLSGTFNIPAFAAGTANLAMQAYIQLPPNMRLNPVVGSINILKENGGVFSTPFVVNPRNPSQLTASFNATVTSAVTYDFEVDVEAYNPHLWDCNPKILTVGALVGIQVKCHEEDDDYCLASNSVLSRTFELTLEKNNADIVPNNVRFIESYDYTLNQHKLTVKAKVRNLDNVEIEDLNFYLYVDNNYNGILDAGDMQVAGSVPITVTIPPYTTVDIEQDFSVDATEICNLMLALPKTATSGNNVYLCKESFEVGPLNYEIPTFYRICQQDGITLGDPAKSGYGYFWTGSDDVVKTYLGPDQAQVMLAFPSFTTLTGSAQTQNFTLNLKRNVTANGSECEENIFISVYVEPKYSTWIGTSTAWENTNNWHNGLPGKCTYVTIPENALTYPVLTRPLNDINAAKCDTIEFWHSGEVARTHLLDYNAAKINLRLEPDRWSMVSAPLRYMYTGDYYVNGFDPNAEKWGRTPDVYWMYYRMGNPTTGKPYNQELYWSMPFNILDETMDPGKGLVVWADLQTNMTGDPNPTHLQSGRITPPQDSYFAYYTFPRKENSYYYYNGIGFSDPKYTGTEKQGDRAKDPRNEDLEWQTVLGRASIANSDSLRSRFTYEGLPSYNPATGAFTIEAFVDKPTEPMVLVGNPLMSHLDLNAFYAANSSIIQPNFYVWSNRSTGFFEAVKLLSGEMDMLTTGGGNIAPMQSFIVLKRTDRPAFTPFTINPTNMSVINPGDKLRAGSSVLPLNISIYRGDVRESAVALVYDENVLNNYAVSKDQYTLFPKDRAPIILHALANESGINQAVSIHTFGELTKAIPLALRTNRRGELLTFRASGLEAFLTGCNVYLEDTSTKKLHNFRSDSTYMFTNFTGNIDEGRFYIRFGNATDINNPSATDFYVYSSKGMVYVYSESDPIEKIEVYNLQGQRIWAKDKIRNDSFSFDMSDSINQAVIVRVITQNGMRSEKLMIAP